MKNRICCGIENCFKCGIFVAFGFVITLALGYLGYQAGLKAESLWKHRTLITIKEGDIVWVATYPYGSEYYVLAYADYRNDQKFTADDLIGNVQFNTKLQGYRLSKEYYENYKTVHNKLCYYGLHDVGPYSIGPNAKVVGHINFNLLY